MSSANLLWKGQSIAYDPRTGLSFITMPVAFQGLMPDILLHWYGEVEKVKVNGAKEKRLAMLTDECFYLMTPEDDPCITRCIPVKHIDQLIISDEWISMIIPTDYDVRFRPLPATVVGPLDLVSVLKKISALRRRNEEPLEVVYMSEDAAWKKLNLKKPAGWILTIRNLRTRKSMADLLNQLPAEYNSYHSTNSRSHSPSSSPRRRSTNTSGSLRKNTIIFVKQELEPLLQSKAVSPLTYRHLVAEIGGSAPTGPFDAAHQRQLQSYIQQSLEKTLDCTQSLVVTPFPHDNSRVALIQTIKTTIQPLFDQGLLTEPQFIGLVRHCEQAFLQTYSLLDGNDPTQIMDLREIILHALDSTEKPSSDLGQPEQAIPPSPASSSKPASERSSLLREMRAELKSLAGQFNTERQRREEAERELAELQRTLKHVAVEDDSVKSRHTHSKLPQGRSDKSSAQASPFKPTPSFSPWRMQGSELTPYHPQPHLADHPPHHKMKGHEYDLYSPRLFLDPKPTHTPVDVKFMSATMMQMNRVIACNCEVLQQALAITAAKPDS
eukprot:NODE_915_length_1770_cov_20.715764_g859_i0.p1 GENE.NODE_915_length_1770_cov_20.715764_g859_i0~~NODE_915_length_1770_cov_20.715764_g859_i0.p1  ORF type:complete len:552 (-),score=132.50 NODE_915_length_1770_cov_20.715764_g859_i0:40-1695(-)